ncbi:MAG: sugar phosphate isomerase/epimerase [Planctomycetaceae bacterium]|nr:sugar phosphate isomerase/epimerase [Planctomycetaceae bacterium]
MQLGFVSAILPDLSFDQVFATAKEIGFDCVEVCCWPSGKAERRYAGVSHIDVANLTEHLVTDIRKKVDKSGVQISGLGYYPNPLSPNSSEADAAVAHLHLVIEAAFRLGIDRVNTFVGRDWTKSVDDNWPRFLSTWQPLIKLAEHRKVHIGIENCPMLFTADEWPGGKNLATTPDIWTRMFHDIPSPNFGLNYDPSHMIWQHMDYLAPMREFRDRLFHIHAKDVRLDQQKLDRVGIMAHPNRYHTPKLPGMGDVNWGKFFSTLTDCGYRGPVCVEVEDRAYEGSLNDRIASLQQSYNYLRNFVPQRRTEE